MTARTGHSSAVPQVAVIGCGQRGAHLVRHFYQLGALAMVCDMNEAARESALRIAPGVPVASHLNEVTTGAVVIATPAATHYDIARQALETGRDVMVEKPLALTFAQGARLVQLAREQRRILMVGHMLEYHPAITRLMEMVQHGELGKIHYVYANRLNPWIERLDDNILWSFAAHDIAIMLRLLGGLPLQVATSGGDYVPPKVVDVTMTNMLFDQGVRAHTYVSWLHPYREQRLVVVGSAKMVSFDELTNELMLYNQPEAPRAETAATLGQRVPFDPVEPRRVECEAFLRAIATRETPLTNGESELRVMRVLQAAQRSLVTNGEPVPLLGENAKVEG